MLVHYDLFQRGIHTLLWAAYGMQCESGTFSNVGSHSYRVYYDCILRRHTLQSLNQLSKAAMAKVLVIDFVNFLGSPRTY